MGRKSRDSPITWAKIAVLQRRRGSICYKCINFNMTVIYFLALPVYAEINVLLVIVRYVRIKFDGHYL